MNPTNELFNLVKSLSSSEKRYFKLNTSLQKGSKIYIRLFEVLDAQKTYDEKSFREKNKNENFIRNFNFNKNYLSRLIYKSLQHYENENSFDAKLFGLLCKSRSLFDKALYSQYFKSVRHGKKLAEEHEKFTYLLEFLELGRQLARKEDLPKLDIGKLYDKEIEVIEKMRNINFFKRIVSELLKMKRLDGIARSKESIESVSLIMDETRAKEKIRPMSLIAKERYYFAETIALEICGNFEESFSFHRKRFKLISDNAKVFEKFIMDNKREALLSLIIAAISAGKFSSAEKLHRQYLLNVSTLNDRVNSELIEELKMLHRELDKISGKFNSCITEKFLHRCKDKLNIDTFNQMQYDLTRVLFVTGEFENALKVINAIFDSKYLKYTPYLEPYVRMLNLLIHYELGNFTLLKYLISSTEKFLKSRKKLYKTETLLLEFLKRTPKREKSDNDKKLYFVNLKKAIAKISTNKFESNGIQFLSIDKWIQNTHTHE